MLMGFPEPPLLAKALSASTQSRKVATGVSNPYANAVRVTPDFLRT